MALQGNQRNRLVILRRDRTLVLDRGYTTEQLTTLHERNARVDAKIALEVKTPEIQESFAASSLMEAQRAEELRSRLKG